MSWWQRSRLHEETRGELGSALGGEAVPDQQAEQDNKAQDSQSYDDRNHVNTLYPGRLA